MAGSLAVSLREPVAACAFQIVTLRHACAGIRFFKIAFCARGFLITLPAACKRESRRDVNGCKTLYSLPHRELLNTTGHRMAAHLKSDQRRVYLFKRSAKALSHGAGESSRAQAKRRGCRESVALDEKTPQTYYGTCGWKSQLQFTDPLKSPACSCVSITLPASS